jgi:hypothetical protein
VNNSANAGAATALLATVESGSSYAIDAGLYQGQQGLQGARRIPAFGPVQATYYIPRDEPAAGPRWFVVQVANAFNSSPAKVTNTEYLLFTQAVPGGAWRTRSSPTCLSGAGAPRQVAVGSDGLATAVSASAASARRPRPARRGDRGLARRGRRAGATAIADPGNLADVTDERFWQGEPQGARRTVTDTHAAARATDGHGVRPAREGELAAQVAQHRVGVRVRQGHRLTAAPR